MSRILIMGLPGSGKTTLADLLKDKLSNTRWYNADNIRKQFDDWDFSPEGRERQARRMRHLADLDMFDSIDYTICDFVAPTPELRNIFNPNITIWMDTISEGRFEDTNKIFVAPSEYDYRITEYDSEKWSTIIADDLDQVNQHFKFGFNDTIA